MQRVRVREKVSSSTVIPTSSPSEPERTESSSLDGIRGGPRGSSTKWSDLVNKATLKKFRTLLTDKRDEILKKAKQTLEQDMALDTDDLPDEMDLASSEYLQSFTFRLRGREKSFLDKIEKALKKIDEGSFGVCEECGEEISVKRLEARPETTLCIRCKEDQERMEKDYT